jgi:sugar transferase (PEP-CTERM/EpsH1 system associated)
LAARHRVFLGTFVDDPEDEAHIDTVRALCASLYVARLNRRNARLASLAGIWTRQALTLRYYADTGLQRWVEQTLATRAIDAAVVFSSSMAQYAQGHAGLPMLVDFVDVDSSKWTGYADAHRWPMSWLYRREGIHLLAYERAVSARAQKSFFVTEQETALFAQLAPECAQAIEPMGNGVDAHFFAPDAARESPFGADEMPLVFTGAMDYWPNVDAVCWFVADVLPALLEHWPALRFHIVGRSPSPAVRKLASNAVSVTGTVPDVRPYLQHAAVVVAPLRLARGIQNKILEAMAMARPVVAARVCVEAIAAEVGVDLLSAANSMEYAREIDALLRDPKRAAAIGAAGRSCVVRSCSWEAHLAGFDRHLARFSVDRPGQAA